MFTGIIEEVGQLIHVKKQPAAMELTVQAKQVLQGTRLGDSIAVNGVCLTVTRMGTDVFCADVMPETMKRTNLRHLHAGAPVNLERALAVGDRLGGHFVQGHVDGVGTIQSITPLANAVVFRIQVEPALTDYMIPKGSVAVNGISLTLVDVEADAFSVSIIPHTLHHTQLQQAKPGDQVNIECDMIGKYLAKWVKGKPATAHDSLSMETLKKAGFLG
ncbi:riboflavin synthase [Laceyella putida]|uniref:Riboflavin synthase n=1 Tax=Laceyella putida TaxID=110101 RepID=A0ABW2RM72_9BACL